MELLNKIKSVKLCLMAHPDNEKDSEFEDRISDLEDIEKALSKYDEMLEMLNKIVLITESFQGTFENFTEHYNNEIKKLIKEATEL